VAAEDQRRLPAPHRKPVRQRLAGIIGQIHHTAHPVLLGLENLDAFLGQIDIRNRGLQKLPMRMPVRSKTNTIALSRAHAGSPKAVCVHPADPSPRQTVGTLIRQLALEHAAPL